MVPPPQLIHWFVKAHTQPIHGLVEFCCVWLAISWVGLGEAKRPTNLWAGGVQIQVTQIIFFSQGHVTIETDITAFKNYFNCSGINNTAYYANMGK
jgi:hypothetical protein